MVRAGVVGERCAAAGGTRSREVLVLLVPVMVVAVVVAVVKPRNLGVCGRLPVSSACPELETAPVAFCSNDLSKLHPPNIALALPPCSYNRYAGREFWTTAPGLCPLRSPRFHFSLTGDKRTYTHTHAHTYTHFLIFSLSLPLSVFLPRSSRTRTRARVRAYSGSGPHS